MGNIAHAIRAANARKIAAGIGSEDKPHGEISFSSGAHDDRAVFSGFDIDYDELVHTVNDMSIFFMRQTVETGLHPLFQSCWVDGFLVGLMLRNNNVAPHHAPPDPGGSPPDDAGAGGENNTEDTEQ